MQTSPPGHSSPRRTGMFAWECQSCRWDIVASTSTGLQETYWHKKCHKKDSHWIFKVSNMMFPSVAQSRWAIRKPSSRSYQSIHEHKNLLTQWSCPRCWRYKKRKWVASPCLDKAIRPRHSQAVFFVFFLTGFLTFSSFSPAKPSGHNFVRRESELQGSCKIYSEPCSSDIIILKYFTFFCI